MAPNFGDDILIAEIVGPVLITDDEDEEEMRMAERNMARIVSFVYTLGTLAVGIFVLSVLVAISGVLPESFDVLIKSRVVLTNESEAYSVWKCPPAPVYMQFFFFNLTNPEEVLKGEKPAVVEVGPYTYREFRSMDNITFLENNTKVSAVNNKYYVFIRDKSIGSEKDLIRTVNIPVMTVMTLYRNHPIEANLISSYLRSTGEGLFSTHPVKELLWGYQDPLLHTLKKMRPKLEDSFGLFYKNNNTNDGEYVFNTGKDDYKDFAKIDSWNGQSFLTWWTSDQCNMINGTDGASFHSFTKTSEQVFMFSSDLCRSLYAEFVGEVEVMGVKGHRYVPPKDVFANLSVNPSNAGFCVPAGNCLGSGLLNVSVCKQGAPIIMSSPHFYQAEEKYVKDVIGMKPEASLHQTVIDIDKITGSILRANKRLQINVFVEQIPTFTQTGSVRTLIFPIVHLNESAMIDKESAEKLRAIAITKDLIQISPMLGVFISILLGGLFTHYKSKMRIMAMENERRPLLR